MSQELPGVGLARVISEAAFDPAKWTDVCNRMARLASADGGIIVPIDVAQRTLPGGTAQKSIGLPHSAELEGLLSVYLGDGWHKQELRARGVPAMLRRGYMTDADCIAYDDIAHSGYYQDYLRTVGFRWFAGLGIQAHESTWVLTLQRNLHREPFSSTDCETIMPYRALLNASAAIARQLGFARVSGASSALEQQGLCTIALDANERVVRVSPSAEQHLGDGLQVCGGRLHAKWPADIAGLNRLIRGICGKDASGSQLHVSLTRSAGRRPLVLYGCALSGAECDVFQPAAALLVISDPDRPQDIPVSLLMDYFGLTRSEAALAAALMRGTGIDQHAIVLNISPVTARNHLQALLRKTSTHRQADLIAILNKVVPRN